MANDGQNSKGQRRTSNVPGQFLGYSLQPTRLVARLLNAPKGSRVSLEVFGDVGMEAPDGTRTTEEDKSTSTGNPVADRAEGLWKTFYNWLCAVQLGALPLESTSFVIYVSRDVDGEIVRRFDAAATTEEAREALNFARQVLWGPAPLRADRASVAPRIKDFVEGVLGAREDLLCQIINAFSLEVARETPHEDLREQMEQFFLPEDVIDDALDHALGWVKRKVDMLIERALPAVVSRDKFHEEMVRFLPTLDRTKILRSFAGKPTQDQVQAELGFRTYVRQLDIIGCEYGEKVEAVVDFLRASVNRTKWSEMGYVDETSYDQFEDSLERAWRNYKRRIQAEAPLDEGAANGRKLYSDCCLHKATLQAIEAPDHFVAGSYHALADALTVGWHPDYRSLLSPLGGGG